MVDADPNTAIGQTHSVDEHERAIDQHVLALYGCSFKEYCRKVLQVGYEVGISHGRSQAYPPNMDDCEDEALILKYLSGFKMTDNNGRPATCYLKPGSQEETKARTALAILLTGINPIPGTDNYEDRPINPAIRSALAGLFMPGDELKEARLTSLWAKREIAFRFRRRGNRGNWQEWSVVASFVAEQEQKGIKREAAVESAMEKFGLSRRSVFQKLKILD
jgi:hypothetical protein